MRSLKRLVALGCGRAGSLAGCVQFEHDSQGGPASVGDGAGPDDDGSGTADATGEPATSGSTPTTGGVGEEAECDLWQQDCPAGSKCAPYDSNSDVVHDTARCVPRSATPGQAGHDCKIEGSVASGLDDCDIGQLCWNTDELNEGSCVEMCAGSPQAPECSEGLVCDISNGGALPLCLQPCDPLTPSCPQGQICLPSNGGLFLCDVDASGDQGAYGDECAFVNVCDPGLFCAAGQAVPGCESAGCCTEYCDLEVGGEGCSGAPEQQCVAYYDPGAAPPGYENVGICAVPM